MGVREGVEVEVEQEVEVEAEVLIPSSVLDTIAMVNVESGTKVT